MMKEISIIEKQLLQKFQLEPFHNLYSLAGINPLKNKNFFTTSHLPLGGTCSAKTISFCNAIKNQGFQVKIHSAFIGNDTDKMIHRLAAIQIKNNTYFADPGNGWISNKLFHQDEPMEHESFGVQLRSKVAGDYLEVFQSHSDASMPEKKILRIPRFPICKSQIKNEIIQNINSPIYPFTNGLRFSLVQKDHFYYLKDDVLYTCQSATPHHTKKILALSKLARDYKSPEAYIVIKKFLKQSFNFDASSIFLSK